MYAMVRRKRISTPEELAASRDIRIAIRQLDHQERYLALLRQAQRIILNSDAPDTLKDIIVSGESELQALKVHAGGKVVPRRRPLKTNTDPNDMCAIFIDECGTHSLTSKDEFDTFVLAAIIVPDKNYPKLDAEWKQWKTSNLGSPNKVIHEPNVRRGTGPFYFNKNTTNRAVVIQSLNKLLAKIEFLAVVCVVNRPDYIAQVGLQSLDKSLPTHLYLMTLDFLMERLVMALEKHCGGARAHVIAEARGPLEDALLQYEYVRLHIDGTSYISAAWFRQQLVPAIEFKSKKENCTGLQIADLLARPCGEKVLDPSKTPPRWPEFREKFCLGQETAHSILGLKIVPWHERYVDIWKS
jgi:hypothetical protein